MPREYSLNGAVTTLYRHRRMLLGITKTEIRSQYAGTVLGTAWLVLYPLLFLGSYSVVFIMILKVRVEQTSSYDYTLLIFSGLIPFLAFAQAIGSGVTAIVANASLVKNTLLPIELLPVRNVFAATVPLLVGLALLQILLWLNGAFHLTQLVTPLIVLLQLLFTIGFVWFLSAFSVLVRDVGQMINAFVLFLMLISPIGYTEKMIPDSLRPFMYWNPLYCLIELYRGAIIDGNINWFIAGLFSLTAVGLFLGGHWFFVRLKPVLADHA